MTEHDRTTIILNALKKARAQQGLNVDATIDALMSDPTVREALRHQFIEDLLTGKWPKSSDDYRIVAHDDAELIRFLEKRKRP
jgi:hypothetical protein